jgi:hypothetical protein
MVQPNRRDRRRNNAVKSDPLVRVTIDGKKISVQLDQSRIDALHNAAVMQLFGVPEKSLPEHKKKAKKLKDARDDLLTRLGRLYGHGPKYYSDVNAALDSIDQFENAASNYRSDMLSNMFDRFSARTPRYIPEGWRDNRYVRRFLMKPNMDAGMKEVKQAYHDASMKEISNWLRLPSESELTGINESDLNKFYQQILDAYSMTHWHNMVSSLRYFLQKVLDIGAQGSSEAAYMFFVNFSEALQTPLESENIAIKLIMNIEKNPFSEHAIGFYAPNYIDAVQTGIFGFLSALQIENQESRRNMRFARSVRSSYSNSLLLTDVNSFSSYLMERDIDPESASKLIMGVPVGERNLTYNRWRKDPSEIRLYETLERHGLEAQVFINFLKGSGDTISKKSKMTRYDVIEMLSEDEAQAAVWMVNNPQVWDSSDLENRIEYAKNSSNTQLRLELLDKWADYSGVQDFIYSRSLTPDHRLLRLLGRAKSLPHEKKIEITPTNIEDVLNDYERAVTDPNQKREQLKSWIDILYPGSRAGKELHIAYDKLANVNQEHRLMVLHDYVVDHYIKEEQEGILVGYAHQIKRMPRELLNTVFSNNQIFNDGSTFAAFNEFLSEPDHTYQLLAEYSQTSNAQRFFMQMLDGFKKKATQIEVQEETIGEISVYKSRLAEIPARIVVLGALRGRSINFLEGRLAYDNNLELEFIDPASRNSTFPQADGVLISYYGAHGNLARGFYERSGLPIKRASGPGPSKLIGDIENFVAELREKTLVPAER